jgi:nucleotide-binding universal stress UspA family protein
MTDHETTPSEESTEEDDLDTREPPRVLIPVEVLEGESISESLVEFLAPSEIVLLGYHVLPEQTPTEQASMQFEAKAREAIEDIAAIFREAGRDVETRVAFTHDRDQTVRRVAHEVGATATLLPNLAGDIVDVLVPIRGAVDVGRLADLVATPLGGSSGTVTLWGQASTGEFDAEATVVQARRTLVDRGLSSERIHTETTESDSPLWDVVAQSVDFDVVATGVGGPGLFASLFGDATERIAEGAVAPVIVVRDGAGDA